MGPGTALGDQLVPDAPRERQVGDPIAVDVAELAPADSEFDPTESVRRSLDAGPGLNGLCDVFSS